MTVPTDGVVDYTTCGGEYDYTPQSDPDVDVVVDIENPASRLDGDNQWLRIPINGIEEWINKDGAAAINRTAKVSAFNELHELPPNEDYRSVFPAEYGIDSQYDVQLDIIFREMLVEETDVHTDFPKCRIFLYDQQIDEHKIVHYGYVGGYGPTDNSLLRKFWVYDISDLLKRIPVGETFSNPTIDQLAQFVVNGEDNTEAPVGVNNATPFEIQAVQFPSAEAIADKNIDELESAEGDASIIDQVAGGAAPFLALTGIFELFSNQQKQFTRNRDNMIDVLKYISTSINGGFQFKPTVDGPILEFRANLSETDYGRRFTDRSAVDDINQFTVATYENTALSDIKPINTVIVNGNAQYSFQERDTEGFDLGLYENILEKVEDAGIGGSYTQKYPSVRLTYLPYLGASNGVRYGPTNVEAPTSSIEATKQYAFDEFMAHMEESTEGEITLEGDPFVLPNDTVEVPPACLSQVPTDVTPLTYEVNDVYHKRFVGERYKTELGVHAEIQKDEDNFVYKTEVKQAE